MNLQEVMSPYQERREKYDKKKASIARLEKQVSKIDLSYKTLVEEIAEALMTIIPGSNSFYVYGPFGLRSDMGLYIDCNAGGVFFQKNLHFSMLRDCMRVTVYPDGEAERERVVIVESDSNLQDIVNLMYDSFTDV
jgi:hypothetical protein